MEVLAALWGGLLVSMFMVGLGLAGALLLVAFILYGLPNSQEPEQDR